MSRGAMASGGGGGGGGARVVAVEMLVIGAGVSGMVTAKCAAEEGVGVVVIERSDAVGGLWHYTEHGYGVMRCTR